MIKFYYYIFPRAQTLDDPYQRFKCVLRWYLSGLYRKPKGLKKPYNPVLGETFRCCWKHQSPETYTYYIAEQVVASSYFFSATSSYLTSC